MEENLTDEIIYELDIIRLLSKMSKCVIQNETKDVEYDSFELIFEDIEKRCWKISEFVEKIILNYKK